MNLAALAGALREGWGWRAKSEIASVARDLGLSGTGPIPVGDDCAALPDGDSHLLFAIEGFIDGFVVRDPWFAGWCGVMVNLSDIAAMGGKALAVVDAIWANGEASAEPILAGMRAAAEIYGVPIVGGHSNLRCEQPHLAVAVLGRSEHLLTSFAARPGDVLVAAIDLRGAYRGDGLNWQAALEAPAERLRGDLALLPTIAARGLAHAAKDISQAGLIGTAGMLAESSRVQITIERNAIPRPEVVDELRWLQSFPSYGFLLATTPDLAEELLDAFAARGIAAAVIGAITEGHGIALYDKGERLQLQDFSNEPLLGCAGEAR